MDILIDGVIFGLQKAGGISRVWSELLEALDQSHFSAAILVPTNQNIEWKELSPKLNKIRVIKRRRFRWGKTFPIVDSLYLTTLCARYRPTLFFSSYYVGMPYGRTHRLLAYHDMIPEKIEQVNPYDQERKFEALKRAHTILAPSQSAKDDLCHYWPQFSHVHVIPHGLTPAKIEQKEKEPFFLFVGKRSGYKDFLPAVTAILEDARFEPYQIKVIGGERARELTHERVEYLGTLPFAEVLEWTSKAAALLFPSYYEGFGLPVLEALALGTPVLARHSSSIPEITGEAYPLIQSNAYGDTLEKLLSEPQWVDYGKERAALFSSQRCWEGYKAIMDLLLSECKKPGSPHLFQKPSRAPHSSQ